MTVIDKISFRFRMADEQFAMNLYAEWDGFCRRCVTDILDEFFSMYDNKGDYIEVDRLDLDLGSIPQEKFYDEFPARLREALEKNFVPRTYGIERPQMLPEGMSDGIQSKSYADRSMKASAVAMEKRFGNLLHYLEHGFSLPEWDAPDFDLSAELSQFMDNAHYRERLFELLAKRPQSLARLFLHSDESLVAGILFRPDEEGGSVSFLSLFFSASFPLGHYERQRYLSLMLDYAPKAVARFIHGTSEAGNLDSMAELLENPHIRRIMVAETEHHAEIDLPDYWYRLYGWLLEYYPFNGVPMYGDKRHFRQHLNRSLLSFIHKRAYPAYLSKAELTVQFLTEIFGAAHYLAVLNIIYHNQRINPDGSPESGDSHVWELYYILLRLSLIRPPKREVDTSGMTEQSVTASDSSADGPLFTRAGKTESFGQWLADDTIPLPDNISAPEAGVKALTDLLRDDSAADAAKRRILLQWFDACRGDEARLLSALDALQDGLTVMKDIAGEAGNYAGKKEVESGAADHAEDSGYKSHDTFSVNEEETNDALLAEQLAWLLSPSVSDTAKSQRLRHYARWQPKLLWQLMRQASVNDKAERQGLPSHKWGDWLSREDMLEAVSDFSLSLAETLRQTMEALTIRHGVVDALLTETLAAFMAGHSSGRTYYTDPSAMVREYIKILNRIGAMPAVQIGGDLLLSDLSRQGADKTQTIEPENSGSAKMAGHTPEEQVLVERLVEEIEAALHLEETGKALKEAAQPEYIEVPNAGLCLLALWLPRLFDMLGLLETGADGKRDFKDTDARIRAIFVLQRLVTDEKREYPEQELAFNRILAACPFCVPLPKTLELTGTELQTVESMLAGVKSNWNKLKGTSVNGFRRSFIERPGKLEQREDKWVLYVEERSYDILLDSLPWPYRRIRLPWLKKRMDVVWRDKEEFDFENNNN